MDIPSRVLRNSFVAVRTFAFLCVPKEKQFVLSSETFFHLQAMPTFEILLPSETISLCGEAHFNLHGEYDFADEKIAIPSDCKLSKNSL